MNPTATLMTRIQIEQLQMKHNTTTDEIRYLHQEMPQTFKLPMPGCQQNPQAWTAKIMPPLEDSNTITVDPKKCNFPATQDKDFKIVIIINLFKELLKYMNAA